MAEQNVIDFEQTDELLDSMDAAIAELRSKASRFRGVIESAAEVPSSERQILLSRLSIDTAYAVESAIFCRLPSRA